MKKFRTIILLCGIAMFAAMGTATAQNDASGTTGDLQWELTDVTFTITGEGAMPDYTFERDHTNAPWEFYRHKMLTVIIGDGVTSIGKHAFRLTGNRSIITSVTIPNSVTTIGDYAFCASPSLSSLTIGNSVTTIGRDAFYRCYGLTFVVIPNSVTEIDQNAFSECLSLTSVTIGNSVAIIWDGAFSYCENLTEVINLATSPPVRYGSKIFGAVDLSACTLRVPAESVELYRNAEEWKDFGTIVGITAGTDATLASLTVNANLMPAFNSSVTDYTADFETVDIVAIPSNTAATVAGAGIKQLQTGENVFDITVTAHDGVTAKTYTVRINHGNASIQETGIPNKFAVYPNPVSSSFTVDYNGAGEVAVFDISGNKMLTQAVAGKTEITVYRLPAGVYTVQLFANGKTIGSAKIIKE